MSTKTLQRALKLLDEGRTVALATVAGTRGSVPAGLGARMIVLPGGATEGTVGGAELELRVREAAIECLRTGKTATFHFDLTQKKPGGLDLACGGSVDVLVEIMQPPAHLLLCGGGHIGLELARLCDQLGYHYSVEDDRPEYSAAERFPGARGRFAKAESFAAFTHVVVAGYSPQVETEMLERVLASGHQGYVGLIGSKAKRASIFRELESRGVKPAALERIECPIGVPIDAETPAEIAVSIMGSVIRSHRGGVNGKA